MYCLDTNIIVDFFRGNAEIVKKVNENKNVSTTMLNLCELFKGAYISSFSELQIKQINDFSKEIQILNMSKASCDNFGRIYSYLRKKGALSQDFDLMVAAIAIAENKTLITKNVKHFENIPNLKIEKW
ncbi:MAG: PIN domain-containing protein [archaeon]